MQAKSALAAEITLQLHKRVLVNAIVSSKFLLCEITKSRLLRRINQKFLFSRQTGLDEKPWSLMGFHFYFI